MCRSPALTLVLHLWSGYRCVTVKSQFTFCSVVAVCSVWISLPGNPWQQCVRHCEGRNGIQTTTATHLQRLSTSLLPKIIPTYQIRFTFRARISMSGEPQSDRTFPFIYLFTQLFSSQGKRTQSRQQRIPSSRVLLPSGHGASSSFSPGSTSHSLRPALTPLDNFCGLPLSTSCRRRLPFFPPLPCTPEPACTLPPLPNLLTTGLRPRLSVYNSVLDRDSLVETISLLFKQQRRYVLRKEYQRDPSFVVLWDAFAPLILVLLSSAINSELHHVAWICMQKLLGQHNTRHPESQHISRSRHCK